MQILLGGVCGETPEASCPDQSVCARLRMTTVGWAATNLQNAYLRKALHVHLPLFPFQFALVSPFLHLALEVNMDLLFRDAETPQVNIKFHQIYGFPAFLQVRFQECRYIRGKYL